MVTTEVGLCLISRAKIILFEPSGDSIGGQLGQKACFSTLLGLDLLKIILGALRTALMVQK